MERRFGSVGGRINVKNYEELKKRIYGEQEKEIVN